MFETGDYFCPSTISGLERIKNAASNKGLAWSWKERQSLRIHGLLPPVVKSVDEQIDLCLLRIDRLTNDLDKYQYLRTLLETNEKLFYQLASKHIEKILPLVYTPVVGLACQNFGIIYEQPRGLFITIEDKGYIYDVLKNWPQQDVKAICVTDGERILGLGDLGAYGMGIPIGKLTLYTALAGVHPHQTLPITLDVGTNNKKLIDDPLYIGLKRKRVIGSEYDSFVDEFMQAVVQKFGNDTLIQFEDFGNGNAFRLLRKYRNDYVTFNDDIQGTASVVLAGLITATRLCESKISDHVILFYGAGEANLGIAQLCINKMKTEGTTEELALSKIWMFDSRGLIVKNRREGGITDDKLRFAKSFDPIKDLCNAVKEIKPTVLIGASAVGGAFTSEILKEMILNTPRPIIFSLSNPTSKSECTAADAYEYTNGQCIFASGSPYPPVHFENKTYKTGQANNSYLFPGLGLAIITGRLQTVNDDIFLIAADAIADIVTKDDTDIGRIFPPLSSILNVSVKIATKILEYAYSKGIASAFPEPQNKELFVRSQMYDPQYFSALPQIYQKSR